MSVKAMALVWDMECPTKINNIDFKPGHKFVLLAYADHADHTGKSIYPAINTIAKKTGYDERSVQRIAHELILMHVLIEDGAGPRGTNKFYIPFNGGGDKISPLTKFQGDIPSGDIPSGDIPSGDNLTPDLNKRTPENISSNTKADSLWTKIKQRLAEQFPKASFNTWIEPAEAESFDGQTLTVATRNSYAKDWLTNRVTEKAQEISGVFIKFSIKSEEA